MAKGGPISRVYVENTSDFPTGGSSGGSVTVTNTPLPVSQSGSWSVSVSNLPTTQPISGTVSVGNFPASQAVTGTFWQATQPVSIAAPVAVTGTFWPATQPVSIAATVNVADGNGSLTVDSAQLPTSLGVKASAASLSVALASDQSALPVTVSNFPATQPVSGSVSVSNFPATQAVSGTVTIGGSLPAGTNSLGSVTVSNFPATQTTIARGTSSMATGQVAMTAQNTLYLVAAARANRRSITFVPTSQFTYFYGNADLTLTNGAAAVNGAAITLETTAAVYVRSSSAGTMTFVEHF